MLSQPIRAYPRLPKCADAFAVCPQSGGECQRQPILRTKSANRSRRRRLPRRGPFGTDERFVWLRPPREPSPRSSPGGARWRQLVTVRPATVLGNRVAIASLSRRARGCLDPPASRGKFSAPPCVPVPMPLKPPLAFPAPSPFAAATHSPTVVSGNFPVTSNVVLSLGRTGDESLQRFRRQVVQSVALYACALVCTARV